MNAEEKALAPRPLQKCEGLHLIQKEVHGLILVIAEKPSVAQSIAKVLGASSRWDGYLDGNNYIVSWCVGHLVELADASSYDERFA